jgi:uncharacterized DUF497 family protein
MQNENFEWDSSNATAYFAKHGVTFEMAKDVFGDPFIVE